MHNNMRYKMSVAILTLALGSLANPLQAQSLLGSRASMERQNQEAVSYGYSFLSTPQAVSNLVSEGQLVKVPDGQYFELHDVSYPYSRPEVKMFIEHFSSQYYATCGEKLTITSLTRPIDEQPANAASDSVHPTGMAVDMRVPTGARCRSWLERTLLSMERNGVLDVTRERHPAHYHVAVFTHSYESYIAARPAAASAAAITVAATTATTSATSFDGGYTVQKGDTLAVIAERVGTTAAKLKSLNHMRGSKVKAGELLLIPADGATSETVAIAATGKTRLPEMITTEQARSRETTAAKAELTHRVKRGETLWRIANRYGTTAELIKRQNGLKDDVLNPGQVLRIKSGAARNSLASNSY